MSRAEPIWIEAQDALALHERLLALHGGASGARGEGVLRSALSRPRNMFADEDRADLIGLASALTSGVVKNHPFVDGEKRTGFVVGILFLELNGYVFTASETAAAEAVLALAAGGLDEVGYGAFLRENAKAGAVL